MVSGRVDDDVEVDLTAIRCHDPRSVHLGRLAGFHVDLSRVSAA
jgi:hypothetical protein